MDERTERIRNAVPFLFRVVTDEDLREAVAKKTPGEITRVAGELGFDVTGEDLLAAERETRRRALAGLRPAAAPAACAG